MATGSHSQTQQQSQQAKTAGHQAGSEQAQQEKSQKTCAGKAFPNLFGAGLEIPSFFQGAAEKQMETLQNSWNQFQEAAQEAVQILQESCEETQRNVVQCQLQAVNFARENAEAVSCHIQNLMGSQSPAQAAELQISFARNQLDCFTKQIQAFQSIAEKMIENSPAKKLLQAGAERLNRAA